MMKCLVVLPKSRKQSDVCEEKGISMWNDGFNTRRCLQSEYFSFMTKGIDDKDVLGILSEHMPSQRKATPNFNPTRLVLAYYQLSE